MNKNALIISIILNCTIFIMEIIAMSMSFMDKGLDSFRMFTQDSNMFAMLASGIYVITATMTLLGKFDSLPYWVRTLRFMATVCLTLTFIVVVTVLAPPTKMDRFIEQLFSGYLIFLHFLCPIVSAVSFLLFEKCPAIEFRHVSLALIPVLIYAVVLLTLNALRIVSGPYPFLKVYNQSITASILWFVGLIGGTYVFGCFLWWLNKVISKI